MKSILQIKEKCFRLESLSGSICSCPSVWKSKYLYLKKLKRWYSKNTLGMPTPNTIVYFTLCFGFLAI